MPLLQNYCLVFTGCSYRLHPVGCFRCTILMMMFRLTMIITFVLRNLAMFMMTKKLKPRCGNSWDRSQRCRRTGKAMEQVYCWWMICREINDFSKFEYHMIFTDSPSQMLCWSRHNTLSWKPKVHYCVYKSPPLVMFRDKLIRITRIPLPPSNEEFSCCRWRMWSPDIETSYEFIE
jgi:hypothetical protein